MADQLVATVHTPIVPVDLYSVLRMEWRIQVRTEPSRASLLLLLAQWDLETAEGAKCMNFNLGNIKHVRGDGHDYCVFRTWEIVGGQRVELDQMFRAYGALEDGAADYLAQLRTRFGFAWPAVLAGDTADFARRLKLAHYYTAPEADYASGLRARYVGLDAHIGPETSPDAIARIGAIAVAAEPDDEPPSAA